MGASSSGKTSLLRAGLMYHLRKGTSIPGSDRWNLKLITPTQHPLKSLASAFATDTTDDVQRARQMHQAEQLLQAGGGEGLIQLVRASLMKPGETAVPSASKLWLIIDQFEELLAPSGQAAVTAERQLFIRCLTEALADPSTPLGVVVALRADTTDALIPYDKFRALVEQNTVVVTPMTYDQIKSVVQKPAEKMGIGLDPTLLYTLAMDTNGAPGELPLIQQTLLELWRRRNPIGQGAPKLTMEAYMALGGGVKQVMIQQANAAYNSLDEDGKRAARRIFLALCELGEGQEDHRRRAFRSELINERFPAELIDYTLDKLASERLVVVSQSAIATNCCAAQGTEIPGVAWQTQRDESSPLATWFLNNVSAAAKPILGSPRTVDIVHESLVQDWDLLRTWLAKSRSVLQIQRRLESSAREWAQRHRPMGSEYLLGGTQLQETLAFVAPHRDELSDLAQEFVAASRKAQNRLRLRTSILIPIALIAGMAASILSRFILPTVPRPAATAEVQSATPQPPVPDFVNSAPTTGPWQKGLTASTPQSIFPGLARADMPDTLSRDDYVMVPAGKWPSPDNPDEMVEVWWLQPRGLEEGSEEPVPIPPATVSNPAAVGR